MRDDLLQGKKTKTWRMFDEKNLGIGDEVQFIDADTGEPIAITVVTEMKEKKFGDIVESDFDGHNPYPSRENMLETYRGYYGEKVGWDTIIKMLTFELKQ
ncbi:MAG: ASCH domain-containing protein [Candidatus Moraniibacteriota bacterium]